MSHVALVGLNGDALKTIYLYYAIKIILKN
jgi:hypothetical protein